MATFFIKYWIAFICLLLSMCGHPVPPAVHRPERHIAILCYHHLDFFKPTIYSVRLRQFDQHIQTLTKAGFAFVSLTDIENYYYHGTPLPEKSIAITFDDANKSVYTTAYPYLKKKHIPFALFIYPTTINHKYSCSWGELREMAANGVVLGSHSYWHPLLTSPKKSDGVSSPQGYAQWLTRQTAESKKILEEQLGISINYFAIPFGAADTTVLAAIKNAGYSLCLNVTGGNNGAENDPLNLNRTIVYGQTGSRKLLELVSARALPATTSPNNMTRVYCSDITVNITVQKPERYVGPWTLALSYIPTQIVSPNKSGVITVPIHLAKQGFYIAELNTLDVDGLEYKATWLFIYTRKKPFFLP